MASKYHITKDGKKAKKGLYYYMNRAKNRGTSKPGKGSVSDKALEESANTAVQRAGGKKSAAWTRKAGKNPSGGLNRKGIASYRKANPGSKLKMAVTEKNPKGKKKSRRKSFCARMCGMKKRRTGAKGRRDPNSRINKLF